MLPLEPTRPGLVVPTDVHARRSGEDYLQAFLELLPHGYAWRRFPCSVQYEALRGLNCLWGAVDKEAADLLEIESFPCTSTLPAYDTATTCTDENCAGPPQQYQFMFKGLLPDWERNWGLPDSCFPAATSQAERESLLCLIMTLQGGQSCNFFQWVANWVGYDITCDYWSPFTAGLSECGDTRYEYDQTGNYRWYIGAPWNRFYWYVGSSTAVLEWFRAGAIYSESGKHHHCEIQTNPPVFCLLDRWRPAHVSLVFDFTDLDSDDPWEGLP